MRLGLAAAGEALQLLAVLLVPPILLGQPAPDFLALLIRHIVDASIRSRWWA